MMLYEVETENSTEEVEADYFTVTDSGVMFYNKEEGAHGDTLTGFYSHNYICSVVSGGEVEVEKEEDPGFNWLQLSAAPDSPNTPLKATRHRCACNLCGCDR